MDKPENISEQFRIVRILFELDDFNIQIIQTFDGLSEEFCKKIVHEAPRF